MQVTLSDRARAACRRLGIGEPTVERMRAGAVSTYDGGSYLVVEASLPDGRRVRMTCRHDLPGHVCSLRVLPPRTA